MRSESPATKSVQRDVVRPGASPDYLLCFLWFGLSVGLAEAVIQLLVALGQGHFLFVSDIPLMTPVAQRRVLGGGISPPLAGAVFRDGNSFYRHRHDGVPGTFTRWPRPQMLWASASFRESPAIAQGRPRASEGFLRCFRDHTRARPRCHPVRSWGLSAAGPISSVRAAQLPSRPREDECSSGDFGHGQGRRRSQLFTPALTPRIWRSWPGRLLSRKALATSSWTAPVHPHLHRPIPQRTVRRLDAPSMAPSHAAKFSQPGNATGPVRRQPELLQAADRAGSRICPYETPCFR